MKRLAIHSAPRSGSTWLGEIINSHPNVKYAFQPLFSYCLKGFLSEESTLEEIDSFFERLSSTNDEFITQKQQRIAGTLPQFEKSPAVTHLVYKEVRYHHILENLLRQDENIRAIFLIRDPIEVMSSWIAAPREFDPSWDVDAELLSGGSKNQSRKEEFYGLEKWAECTKLFEQLNKAQGSRTRIVRYSELKHSPLDVAQDIFAFCDLDMCDQTVQFLSESTRREVEGDYSVFRGAGETRQAKQILHPSQLERIRTFVTDSGLAHYL